MRVLVLDTLLNQASERKIPPDVLPRLYKEYKILAECEMQGYNAVFKHLTQKTGKELKGDSQFQLYKYYLTDGDRILYTYGKHLPYLHNEKDSLVLLEYADHDHQGDARRQDLVHAKHSYEYLANIVKELNGLIADGEGASDISDDDLYSIASLLVSDCFKGYAYTDEELQQFSPNDIDKHLFLSEEQKGVIEGYQKRNKPTLIVGGAGTGKTLIAVHLLNALASMGNEQSIAYFTQSRLLLQKVQDQYFSIKKNEKVDDLVSINFWDINRFCLDLIDVKVSQIVTTKQFIDVFIKDELEKTIYGKKLLEQLEKNSISYDNVWTEIRGTLKGGMQNWTRISPMSQDDVSINISNLDRLGYIERLKNNKKKFVLAQSLADTIVRKNTDPELRQVDQTALEEIIKYFSTFNTELRSIDDEYYLSLGDECSLLTTEQRKLVLNIYYEYEKYLERYGLYDENDLVRLVIQSGKHKSKLYDFIFIDEVQDYTELQLYLIYELAKNKDGIVFAGDIHQIINPTLFSISKLKELFRDEAEVSQLEERALRTNFRCQQGVINIANNLSQLRREKVGAQSEELEQPEKSNVSICLYDPYRLTHSDINVGSIVKEVSKYPQVAILVPDEATKRCLLDVVRDVDRPDFIFTVDEIKGMKFDYVICYNLISHYIDQWNTVVSCDICDVRTKYRYYFNLLYVAITRARKMLGFLDEQTVPILEERLGLKNESAFDPGLLHFTDLDASLIAWSKQADEFKRQGKYAVALKYYQKAQEMADPADVYDCYTYIFEEKREYESAVRYCILLLATSDAVSVQYRLKYLSELLENGSELKKLARFLLEPKYAEKNISQIVENELSDFNELEKDAVIRYCIERAEYLVYEKIGNKRIPVLH